ncbi:MAG TPA: hypothetical protein VMT54_03800 [Candidatus Cybelea sp.]|nr:hypothetical protein [Candidatus Cybelea sp.]
MAKSDDRSTVSGHRSEIVTLLQAGQMPKGFSPANLPDIDVTPAVQAVRNIADGTALLRPKMPGHTANGRSKS